MLPAVSDQLRASAKAGTVHYSNLIEGNQLPFIEAERAARGELAADTRAKIELVNYVAALDLIDGHLPSGSEQMMKGEFLKELHRTAMMGLGREDDPHFKPWHEGDWRDGIAVVVDRITGRVVHEGPPAGEVPDRMEAMFEWLARRLGQGPEPAFVLAGAMHYGITDVHPFADGNGRAARLFQTALLMVADVLPGRMFSFERYYAEDRSAYYAALRSVRLNTFNMEQWLAYFLRGLAEEYERVAATVADLSALTAAGGNEPLRLTSGQERALARLRIEGRREFTRREYEAAAGVARSAAGAEIKQLVTHGVLVPRGAGPSTRYAFTGGRRPVENHNKRTTGAMGRRAHRTRASRVPRRPDILADSPEVRRCRQARPVRGGQPSRHDREMAPSVRAVGHSYAPPSRRTLAVIHRSGRCPRPRTDTPFPPRTPPLKARGSAADIGRVSSRARPIAGAAAAAAAVAVGSVYVIWLARGTVPGDYRVDFAPSMDALLSGHIRAFVTSLPTDGAGGSVALRAPGALLGKLLGGGPLEVFRFGALECLLVAGALGLWLARGMRVSGAVGRSTVVALSVMIPGVLGAIVFGHPEEVVGAALCVGAVLLAGEERAALAGIALGLAVINKPWGLFAVTPALLAAPGRRARLTVVGASAGVVGAWQLAIFLIAPADFTQQFHGALAVVAHPVDIWWPLASPFVTPGGTHLYVAPPLLVDHARQLALLVVIPLSMPLARRRRVSLDACLALLALLLLLRCLLDPSNHVYYQVPCVIALLAWDARTRAFPASALYATVMFWLVFHTVSGIADLGVQFAAYMAVTLPLAAVLALAVYATGGQARGVLAGRPSSADAARRAAAG